MFLKLNERLIEGEMVKTIQKKQQKPESKERILQAAIFLFARKGFAEIGMRELAARAEVNLSMVNYFFGTKKGLLKEILDSFLSGYLDIAREELMTDNGLHMRIERFVISAITYFGENRDSLIIAISELPHDDPEIIEHKAGWAKKMVAIVNDQICQPLIIEGGQAFPATTLAPMLTSLMASKFLFAPVMEEVGDKKQKTVSVENYSKMIVRFLLRGMADTDCEANSY